MVRGNTGFFGNRSRGSGGGGPMVERPNFQGGPNVGMPGGGGMGGLFLGKPATPPVRGQAAPPPMQMRTASGDSGGGGGGGGGAGEGNNSGVNPLMGNFNQIGGGGAPGNPAFLQFMEQQIRDRMSGGFGIDDDVANAQRAAMTSQSHRQQQGSMDQLTAQLNASGALGGGRNIALGRDMAMGFNENLLNNLAGFDMGLNELMIGDRQAAFGEGNQFSNTLVNQQLGLGDINARNRATTANYQLGQLDDQTRRDLGFGQLDSAAAGRSQQGSQFDRSFGLQQQGQQFNQGLQTFLANMGLLGLG